MMDFARRLAPVAESDPTRAIAVVPSRFAGESPLRESIAAAPPRDEAAAPRRSSLPPSSDAIAPRAAPAQHADGFTPPRAFAVLSPAAAIETDASRPQAVAPTAAMAAPPGRDASAASRVPPGIASPLEPSLPAPDSVATFGVDARSGSRVAFSAAVQAPAFTAPRVEPLHVASRQPLSEAAIASRSPALEEARPVIHVTIDRIEVRAPAGAARAAPVARARVPSASLSLGEYLRRRNGKPGGDA